MSLHDAWTALRHGGNLLEPTALESLPSPESVAIGFEDRLRAALIAVDRERPTTEALSHLLDVALDQGCGLHPGWQKGAHVPSDAATTLLDGTTWKPRRQWSMPGSEALPVYVTTAPRLGVGKGRRPVAQTLEALRRRRLPLALLINGSQWRLMWADGDSFAWVEWETDRWLDAGRLGDEFRVLRWLLSPESLARPADGLGPLLAGIRDSRRGQSRLSKELGERVRRAVEALLRGREGVIGPAWDAHEGSALYVAACHFVMRMVVTLFAEARELLPVDNPVYHRGYGLRGLIDQLDRSSAERRRGRHSAWPRLLALFRLLHQGSLHPQLNLPSYGGDLFCAGDSAGDAVSRALALLEGFAEPSDDDCIHRILVLLTRTTQKVRDGGGWRNVAAPVDFTELTSEYIGILYEGLLDYELHRAGAEPVVFLNLGDQPALPLDRLEAMDDAALRALVEKAKVKKEAAPKGEEGDGDADGADADADAVDGDEADDSAETAAADGDEDGDEAASADGAEDVDSDTLSADDARTSALVRAQRWGRRAVEVGKLVSKPKSRSAEALAQHEAKLDSAARQLVADVKLPGELFLVRWGGTRKGAGTFYTRPKLAQPTVRRTLEPLLVVPPGAGQEQAEPQLRTPEELLALKVCDPAMGSGSFLVAALRVLTEAVVESLHVHGRIKRDNGQSFVDCALLPEADRSLPTEGFDDRLLAVVRRAVVEHCLYGVDIDPLAVELARVALWVETLDRRLPFTFLDHKLRAGDALVGCWLDRFRDYPLLCFDRQSPDDKYSGVNHPAGVWHKALKARRAQAITQQVTLLTGQVDTAAVQANDAELKAAVERMRRLYRELRAVPAGRPDERARIWRERIVGDAALARVREAFDTWCALWFWPLDRLDVMPLPGDLAAPGEAASEVVRAVRAKRRFLHWELEFPDVFVAEGAGFDAVVGNPPWEISKPNSKEFFSNHDPLYRAYGKQQGLGVQRAIFAAKPEIEDEWLRYLGEFKERGNFVRNAAEPFGDAKVAMHEGGDVSLVRGNENVHLHRTWRARRQRFRGTSDARHPYRHQGSADLNTYKMFVEAGHAILRQGGQLGLVVPSGLYTDKGTGPLRRLLLEACVWRWLYGFENRDKLFDIHRSFKFCVVIAGKGGKTEAIQAAFMRHALEDWDERKAVLAYPAERVLAFSPKSLSVLEIRSARDLAVLTKLYANGVLLGDDGPDGWGIEYAREFDMTNDSKLFIARDKAEAAGFRPDVYGRWVDGGGEVLLPLYQGLMFFDLSPNRAAHLRGAGHSAQWESVDDPSSPLRPQYLMREAVFIKPEKSTDSTKVAFRALSNATNERTMVACLLDEVPCGNSVGILRVQDHSTRANAACTGALASLTFDWSMRQRISGTNLNAFFLLESRLPKELSSHVGLTVMRLTLVGGHHRRHWHVANMSGLANNLLPWGGLLAITPHERLRLRCQLDAIVATLYNLNRDDFAWILKDCDHPTAALTNNAFCRTLDPKGFYRVDKDQPPELRHTVLSLVAFDDLQTAIANANGDRDAGIAAFCDQHDGDGWMLPETLCIADLGMTRTVGVGDYDDAALTPQPVRARLGERFLDWQLAQSVEESWAECERHAQVLLASAPAAQTSGGGDGTNASAAAKNAGQLGLFDE